MVRPAGKKAKKAPAKVASAKPTKGESETHKRVRHVKAKGSK